MIKRKDNVSMTVTQQKDRSRRNQFNLKNTGTAGRQDFFFAPVTIGRCSNRRDDEARDVRLVQHEGSRGPSRLVQMSLH